MLQANSRLTKNEWITDPRVPDPENLPEPLGWLIRVRPYPVKSKTKSGIILADETIDATNYLTPIGRVVSIAPCAWNRPEHKNRQGEQFEWVKVGDFVSYPTNVGAKKKFKGVSYLLLMDDEVNEVLRDPLVYDNERFSVDIPEEDLAKFNTIYNPNFKKD